MRLSAFEGKTCGFLHLTGRGAVFRIWRGIGAFFCGGRRNLFSVRGGAYAPPRTEEKNSEKASARREGTPAQSRKSLRAKRGSARTKQKKAPARNGLCLQKFTAFEGRFECGCKIFNRSVVNFWLWAFFLRCSMPTLRKGSAKKPTDFLLKGQKMPLPSTISPSGARSLRFPSASSAHKIIPSLTIPRNLAGLRLVIITTFLPTICSGV